MALTLSFSSIMWRRKLTPYLKARNFSHTTSTIYALSSGQGRCGVAIIRISGSNASNAILKMTKPGVLPNPRVAVLKHVVDPTSMERLDRGLILWFPGPQSFTGEDCCEFQVHGGPAVISSILSALSKIQDFRPAEPGEFTKRAFLNGKLDLTEVEGLADLIHAETEMQRKQALLQMEGTLSKLYNGWRKRLLQNLAYVQAFIDFSEDENIEDNVLEVANEELLKLKNEIEMHLADGRKGERLREGVRTTIIGEPNAGKSSLFNALCQKPAAIVTPIPGTTRDLLEVHINVNDFPMILTDTAGLRKDTYDVIEKEGIERAHFAIKNSDLLLIVIDSTLLKNLITPSFLKQELTKFMTDYLIKLNLKDLHNCMSHLHKEDSHHLPKSILLFNKIDLLGENDRLQLQEVTKGKNMSCISCETEAGFPSFMDVLTAQLKSLCGDPSDENPSLTQARHRYHLGKCCEYLNKYFETRGEQNIPIAAYKLQVSLNELGKITGKVSSEEILDVIFKDFCIGK